MDIKDNPYKFICDYYEEELPCVGRRIFSVLSLVPVSLIIPKIPSLVKETSQKISLLWLSPSGSGKSSIASEFEKIAPNPIYAPRTPARLYHEIKIREGKKTTLICPDVAIMFSDEEMIKILENYIGEESYISRGTMRNIEDGSTIKIEGTAFLAGTPKNISDKRIRDGVLGRVCPILTFFDEEDNVKIIDKINSRIGLEIVQTKENEIHQFYEELYEIQEGQHPEFNPIEGYIISDSIRKEIGEFIKNLPYLKAILKKWGIHSARPLEKTYKFLVAYSFLNIWNREVEDNKLVITQKDCEMAKKLIELEARDTYKIYKAIEMIDWFNIKNERDFRMWDLKMRKANKKVSGDVNLMMQGMVKK